MARVELEFEALVPQILENLDFVTGTINGSFRKFDYEPDFIAKRGELGVLVEVKFYKSPDSSSRAITIALRLLRSLADQTSFSALLIVSSIVTSALKEKIWNDLKVVIWDRSNIANFLVAVNRYDLLDRFSFLLMESQQGIDTIGPFANRIPQHKIASYLGIIRETLSRIRNRIGLKK